MDITIEIPQIISRVSNDTLADRQHEFIISNESPDTYGTVFLSRGWDLSSRQAGKKRVTYGHPYLNDPDPDVIIGVGEERVQGTDLMSILTLEPENLNNRIANAVHGKLLFGSVTDASIRARIMDGRQGDESLGEDPKLFYYTRHKLIDWGVVMEGSTPTAVKTRSDLDAWIKTKTTPVQYRELDLAKAIAIRYYIM